MSRVDVLLARIERELAENDLELTEWQRRALRAYIEPAKATGGLLSSMPAVLNDEPGPPPFVMPAVLGHRVDFVIVDEVRAFTAADVKRAFDAPAQLVDTRPTPPRRRWLPRWLTRFNRGRR